MLAARELQITLTSRNKEKGVAIPMCGVPYHAAEGYIAKLIRKGFKVAICDQMEDPRLAKKLVRREVTRVVTPGTAADSSLSSEENNFLAAHGAGPGIALGLPLWIFRPASSAPPSFTAKTPPGASRRSCSSLRPKEVLYGSSAPLFERSTVSAASAPRSAAKLDKLRMRRDSARRLDLRSRPRHPPAGKSFRSALARRLRPGRQTGAAAAAGAILYYVRSTQRGTLDHVDRIGFYERQNCLVLDAVTVRNLELIEPLFAGTDAGVTLFRSIDATVTPMGKRLLRSWMLRPVDRSRAKSTPAWTRWRCR